MVKKGELLEGRGVSILNRLSAKNFTFSIHVGISRDGENGIGIIGGWELFFRGG